MKNVKVKFDGVIDGKLIEAVAGKLNISTSAAQKKIKELMQASVACVLDTYCVEITDGYMMSCEDHTTSNTVEGKVVFDYFGEEKLEPNWG